MSNTADDDHLNEGVWARVRKDTVRATQSLAFVLVTLVFDAAVATAAAITVGDDASTGTRGLAAALGVVTGTAVSLLTIFALKLVRAPFRQRDQARQAVASTRCTR